MRFITGTNIFLSILQNLLAKLFVKSTQQFQFNTKSFVQKTNSILSYDRRVRRGLTRFPETPLETWRLIIHKFR